MNPSIGGWIGIPVADIASPTGDAAATALRIQEEMLRRILLPKNFAQEAADLLVQELNLAAASLFIRTRGLNAFLLRAAHGFPYAGYQSFLLPNPSYPSLACETREPRVLVAVPPFDPSLYRDLTILDGLDIASLVVVPFSPPQNSDTDYPDPLGVLCLYPRSDSDLDAVVAVSSNLQRLIGAIYVASLDRQCMQLRSLAVQAAAFGTSLTHMAESLVALMCEELSFDAGSAWLLNPRRQQLQLRACHPRPKKGTGDLLGNVVRLSGESYRSNPLAQAFLSTHKTHYPRLQESPGDSRHYATFAPEKIAEDFGASFHNTVAVPLKTGRSIRLGSVERKAVGVIQLTNKAITLGGIRHYIPTTWEDLKLVSYLAEISTILVFQGLQALDHESDYERRIHGLKINLISARDTLTQLEERGGIEEIVTPRLRYHLPNSIEWIREMEQQVGRSDKIDRLKVTPAPMSIRAGVAKAVRSARTSARANQVDPFEVDAEALLGASRPSPLVVADDRAFLTVLRNLFENSMKYRLEGADGCVVRLWFEIEERKSQLHLHFGDNGIGIPGEDQASLFTSGFRGHRARRVNVLGQGIGLHECAILMHAMQGEIRLARSPMSSVGCEFVLTLPLHRSQGNLGLLQ